MDKKPCKECPWIVRNKHNDTIINFSKKMDKSHNCHMVNKNIWDTNDKQICEGRKLFYSEVLK
jgi:hypothetical protein